MSTTVNPFQDDPVKAEVFEQGLTAGFNDPDGSDFRPFPSDLLQAFQEGFQVGREDKNPPPGPAVVEWMTKDDVANFENLGEEAVLLALTLLLDHLFETAVFSCVDVVKLALDPAGDTQLQPLPPDFRAGFNAEESDPAIHFIAVCPRPDHDQVSPGVTGDGHWTGQDRNSFLDAVNDMTAHGHSETFVARCDFNDNTCGPVWLAAKQ